MANYSAWPVRYCWESRRGRLGRSFARRDPFGVQYFHHDRLGSVTEMTQDNGGLLRC
jgi:hypothetical protein